MVIDKNNYKKYIIIGIFILIVLGLIGWFNSSFHNTYKLHYSENSDLDYKVYLDDNNYFDEDYLGKNKVYVSSLINKINTEFKYSFKTDTKLDLTYSYYIDAKVQINTAEGKNILEKKYKVLDNKEIQDVNNSFTIDEKDISIDYKKYNELASSFLDRYSIDGEALLKVGLYVNVQGNNEKFEQGLSDNAVVSLTIPLTKRTTDISLKYDLSNNKDAVLQYKKGNSKAIVLIVIVILSAIDIAFMVYVYLVQRNLKTPEELFEERLKNILTDYSRYISETKVVESIQSLVETRSLRIVLLKTFDGLIAVRDNVNKPILYQNEKTRAVFYIISDNIGYIYIMKVSDFESSKKLLIEDEIEVL